MINVCYFNIWDISNYTYNKKIASELEDLKDKIYQMGPQPSLEKNKAKGKLNVRERIALLKDNESSFIEFSELAGYKVYKEYLPAGGIITGLITVAGRNCIVIANDATVKGGSYFPLTVKKHLRAQEIAMENQLPCIYLVDSGGAFLPKQDEVFPDKEDFGRIFFNQARLSANNIPQIAVVMGSCTAGGAYIPAMADVCIIVKQQGTIFLGGPPLVKAATGEVVSAENLGGADVHCRQSGVADYYADDDEQALSLARICVRNLNLPPLPQQPTSTPPLHPKEELLGLIPTDPRMPIEMREIIARLVDASEFDEFKQLFGTTLICGFARIDNHLIGIIANNGILFSDSALKGTQFIQICNIPKRQQSSHVSLLCEMLLSKRGLRMFSHELIQRHFMLETPLPTGLKK